MNADERLQLIIGKQVCQIAALAAALDEKTAELEKAKARLAELGEKSPLNGSEIMAQARKQMRESRPPVRKQ